MGQNLPQLFHVGLEVSACSQTALMAPFLLPPPPLLSVSVFSLFYFFTTLPPHVPVFSCPLPPTEPPLHLPLKEHAAISFANNKCRQSTKEPKAGRRCLEKGWVSKGGQKKRLLITIS